jgi:predicted secreted protein
MTTITYRVVRHDGGWAFKLGDTFSETFPTHDAALRAVRRVAAEQQVAGQTRAITWEDTEGRWHEEIADGGDRPEVEIKD